MPIRNFLKAAVLAGSALLGLTAHAQDFKAPIRLIVPFAPGGATDVLARLLSPKIAATLGQTVIVENKPGAGGQLGLQAVQQAKPDGTTFGLGADQSLLVAPLIMPNVPYEGARDFAPVGMIVKFQFAFSTSLATGAKAMPDFLNYVRANPGKANFGVPAQGGMPQMIGTAVGNKAGVSLVAAPYNGAAPMLTDLIGGQISAGVSGLAEALTLQRAGKVHILAVSGDKRSNLLPDTPTLTEAGVAGMTASNWQGVFAPKGLPEAMQRQFNSALNKALADPEVKQRIQELSMELYPTTLDEARAEVARSSAFWTQVANTPGSGLKP